MAEEKGPGGVSSRQGPDKTKRKEAMDHISHHLRLVFNEVADEPVPDRFSKLLEELEKAEDKGAAAPARKDGAAQGADE